MIGTDFESRVAVITGAANGIGEQAARQFASRGARVVIADTDGDGALRVAHGLTSAGGKALGLSVDVSEPAQVGEMFEQVRRTYGGVDILVNNAGWDFNEPFINNTPELWDQLLAINLKSQLYCCQAVLAEMTAKRWGRIVNTGSDAGRVGTRGSSVYAAAKGAVIAFTKSLAREVARDGILVNCVCPGPTDTRLFRQTPKDVADRIARGIPLRRVGEPAEVAAMIVFLASPAASYITGQVVSVSGGLTMAG